MPTLKIFIGFSSANADVGLQIAAIVDNVGHAATCWNQSGLFNPGQYTYNRLMELTREYDGAIFIFGCDDPVVINGVPTEQPRDNVLIEFGLFSGALGLEAVCFCRLGNSKTAIDLAGITYIDLAVDDDGNVRNAVQLKLSRWLSSLATSKNKIQSMAKIRDLDSNFPLLQLYTPKDPEGKPLGDHTIYALSDSCKQFFGYRANAPDKYFYQKPAKPFLDKLKKYISPPDQFWDDLTEDQRIVYQKLDEGKLPLARVPVCFNGLHDSFKNQTFVPIIVQKEQIDGGEVMTILYVESTQLPKSLLGNNVWRDISNGIDMSDLASELAAMAENWDVAEPRKDALMKASEEARKGGSMTVALYLAEAGFYSCRNRAAEGKFETVLLLLDNLVPNLIPDQEPA